MARKTATSFAELPVIAFGLEDGELGPGDEFQGYYKGVKTAKTKYGEKPVYTFQTPDGDCQVWGSANLNPKMEQVKLGCLTFIEFVKLEKSKERGRNPTKIFKVEYDDADCIEVEAPRVSFQNNQDAGDEGEEQEEGDEGQEEEQDLPDPQPQTRQASKPAVNKTQPTSTGAGSAPAAGSGKSKLDAMLSRNKQRASA